MSAPYGLKLKKAIANGNWSDTSTWGGGVKPVAGDVVATNGFDVTVDEDVEVYHITNVPVQDYRTRATPAMTSHITTDSISGLNGEVVEYGPADEVYNSPKEDYTKKLLSAIPRGIPRGISEDMINSYMH